MPIWEIDLKAELARIEIIPESLSVNFWSEREIVKSGKITEQEFETIKNILNKILTDS